MGFLSDAWKVVSGQTGADLTGDLADSIGLNEALDDAGLAQIGTAASAFDPLDLAGTVSSGKAKDAVTEAEAAQLAALDTAQLELRTQQGIAQGFLDPFAGVGQQGVDIASFLTSPQEQFDFLQNNPLFQLGLDNANTQTNQMAASRGRLSSGDTLQQLNNNALLVGQPLIADQKNSIIDLLNFGSGTSRAQANAALGLGSDISGLIQDQGNVQAASIASQNAISQQSQQNNQQLAGTIAGALLSDPKLKTNKKPIGKKNGFTLWSWDWNELANEVFGLSGAALGVMADEVLSKMPEAITYEKGFMKVNYTMVGV